MTSLQIVAAMSLLLVAVTCSLRAKLLGSHGRGWPKASALVRWPLALVALACMGRAIEIIARDCAVGESETVVYAAIGLSALATGLNVLLQRVGWLGHAAAKLNGVDYSRNPPTIRPH